MLVLTRKRMEKLYIGRDICVTVVRLEGGQVRLGIDAPRHVPVVRAELKERDAAAAALAVLGDAACPASAPGPSRTTPRACWPRMAAPLADRLQEQDSPAGGPGQPCGTKSGSRKR